jgi:hypothetical protein
VTVWIGSGVMLQVRNDDEVLEPYTPTVWLHAYRMAIERDPVLKPLEPTAVCRPPEYAADREIELG